ncbi:MAG TPA: chemotaxis protein CheB, partial [Spirosoma sp.]|nr:chemotaxis protein CheB [Spirosoma sp.]
MLTNLSTGQSPGATVPIVAIGASTGGLEAVAELLANLPPTTGLAFVYIQSAIGPAVGGSGS